MKKFFAIFAVIILVISIASQANAVPITVDIGSWYESGIGNTFGGSYDTLTYTGTITPIILDLIEGIPYSTQVGTIRFAVGNTGSGSAGIYTGEGISELDVDGVLDIINLPWTVTISSRDRIEVGVGNTTTIDLGLTGLLDITLRGWGYSKRSRQFVHY